jgi:hypothetical protein
MKMSDRGCAFVPTKDGGIWLSCRITGDIKAEYISWLVATAWNHLYRAKKKLDLGAYAEAKSAVGDKFGSNSLGWSGNACVQSLLSAPGMIQLASLLAQAAVDKAGKKQDASPLRITNAYTDPDSQDILIQQIKEICKSNPDFFVPPELMQKEPSDTPADSTED